MKPNHHIEVIHGGERLSPELGGTGYLAPQTPSTVDELKADLIKARQTSAQLGVTVWKVKRTWPYSPRRLTLPNGRYLKCKTIGGTGRAWWFVSVNVRDGIEQLSRPRMERIA